MAACTNSSNENQTNTNAPADSDTLAADSTADTQAPNDIVSDSESAFADTDIEADSQSGSASSESSASADITDIGYDHLIIGVDDTFAPMGFLDENNELVGFDTVSYTHLQRVYACFCLLRLGVRIGHFKKRISFL